MQSAHTCPADRPPAPPPRDSSRSHSLASSRMLVPSAAAADIEDIEVDDLLMLDDDLMIDVDGDDDDDDDDLLQAPPTKHFLDYDSQPPPGFEALLPAVVAPAVAIVVGHDADGPDAESVDAASAGFYPGEARRVDKKYETDGEISDFELDTYSQTMRARRAEKALSAEDAHQQHHPTAPLSPVPPVVMRRKKHFLDENPIAPDDEEHCVSSIPVATTAAAAVPATCHAEREHRSLDRNYDRAKELHNSRRPPHQQPQKPPSRQMDMRKQSHSAGAAADKSSLMNASITSSTASSVCHAGRRRETSFALARFLEHDPTAGAASAAAHRTNGTWPLTDRSGPDQTHTQSPFGAGGSERLPHPHALGGSCSTTTDADSAPPKVECVYSLLSMLGCNDQIVMSRKFLELSQTPESCASLRQARSIPLIVQIIHSDEADEQTRRAASRALHNVVNCHPDDKAGRREAKVLRHIEHVMEYCEALKQMLCDGEALADDRDRHPLQAMSSLMKISFDEEHRHAMCQLGALHAIASVVQYDHAMHGNGCGSAADRRPDDRCVALRRYAAMALTNLTFGDGNNKAALCANRDFMRAFVGQLTANADDLLPVTANVLRNLSWRADPTMKQVLSEIGTVTALTQAVMHNRNESTIKALLSALWNLSAHCAANKAEFCGVDGALAFLVDMLSYEGPSRTLTIIENAGGVLRNVSSHIAVSEPYRRILRQRNCLAVLLAQLSSESLTIVSNACGALWNLSARCPEDQRYLLDNRAVPRLSLLVHSKHKMISNGSSAALKNLLNFRPGAVAHGGLDAVAKAMRLRELPTLTARKLRAFAEELDHTLSETCENIEITTPPKEQASNAAHSLGFATASRLTKSDTAAARSLVPRCESNSSLVSLAAGRSAALKPTSHSSPSTPKRTPIAGRKARPPEAARPIVTTPSRRRYPDNDSDQTTDFSVRYGGDGVESEYTVPALNGTDVTTITIDSPDKCVRYAEEGTPVAFQSYQSANDARALDVDEVITVITETTAEEQPHAEEAETTLQTPLMFSRRSSLCSLSSMEVPDIHSAATSDFSRLASGAMSPSELPDSPSQMMQMQLGNMASGDEAKIASDLCGKEAHVQPPPVLLNKPLSTVAAVDEESLSSMDSNVEDRVIFQQAIRIGSKVRTANTPLQPQQLATMANDPFSSIDSVDSMADAGQNSPASTAAILEQCIQMGIHKKPSRLPAPMSSPKRSQLPLPKATPRNHHAHTAFMPETFSPLQSMQIDNGALDRSLQSISDFSQILDRSNEYPAANGDAIMSASIATDATDVSANNALNMEQSNEFMLDERELHECDEPPAEALTVIASSSSTISDKHKDPDLMLQSVDRLTHELVSTAEYLRSSAVSDPAPGEPRTSTSHSTNTTVFERKSSSSNNTWNEDTCPNEVSFPSISWTAPALAADDDDADNTLSRSMAAPPATRTAARSLPSAPVSTGIASQPDSLDTDTATLVNDDDRSMATETDLNNEPSPLSSLPTTTTTGDSGIRFHVGGPTFRDHHRLPAGVATALGYQLGASRHYTFDAGTSAMTNSTIIALEANKLLQRMPSAGVAHLTDSCSSLDVLEDIRPPSGMDSCSAYFESQPNSMVLTGGGPTSMSLVGPPAAPAVGIAPLFSPQLARRKKSLPAGLMAKRALHHFAVGGHGGGGSLESVHSSCILENIKPPSIMDELMDSMISVASITSEVASPDNSQYDTAVSQMLRHDDEQDDDDDDDRTEAPGADDDDDDDTTTLRSCFDMPAGLDAGALLLDRAQFGSDASSADSTPVRKVRSVRRALTLKQKRQVTKERYRTYTIAADMMLLDSADEAAQEASDDANANTTDDDDADAKYLAEKLDADKQMLGDETTQTVQIEIVEGKAPRLTPRQRRQDDRVRFQTQIIESFHLDALKQSPDHHQHIGDITTSSGSNSLDDDADMASIRALTERFRHINNPESPASMPQPTSVLSHPNRNLETIVATEFDSLELSADEHELNSRHSEDESPDMDVDPLTYIDEQTYNISVPPSAASSDVTLSPSPPSIVCKPKIVKPNAVIIGGLSPVDVVIPVDSEPKAIRGKKKAAYVSPYRKSTASPSAANSNKTNSAMPTTTSTPTKPRPGAAFSKLIATKTAGSRSTVSKIVAKTHVLLHKSAGGGLATKLTPTSGRANSIAKLASPTAKTTPAPPAMPERQGTFVKDEPSEPLLAAAMPPIVHVPLSPAKATKLPTKLPVAGGSPTKTAFVSKLRNPLQRSASTTVTTTTSPRSINTPQQTAKVSPDQTATAAAKRRSIAGVGGGVFYRSPSTPSVPQRSNSNASLTAGGGGSSANISATSHRTSQPPSRSNSNLSKPMAGVSSRIASIWRKPVPDSNKTTAPKTARPATQQQAADSTTATPTATRLIRSSTFDNTPTAEEGAPVAAAVCAAAEPRSNVVPLRRRPNGVPMPTPPTGEADKKRLSRLVNHHHSMMAPIPRLY